MSIKQKLARKAVKATAKTTAKHTAHGTASKLKRNPLRSTALLGLGAVIGGLAGWFLGRSGNDPQPVG